MARDVFTWKDGSLVPFEWQMTDFEEMPGDLFVLPNLANGHAHLLDGLIEGEVPNDIEKAVVGPGSFKHAGIRKILMGHKLDELQHLFSEMFSNVKGPLLEFRDGGRKGAMVGRLSRNHLLLGRPGPDDDMAFLDLVDGIGLSGIDDHPDEYIERWNAFAKRRSKLFSIHAFESKKEDIERILSLEPDFLIHMSKGGKRTFDMLAEENVPVVICPRSSTYFGHEPPVKEMLRRGVFLALGTDNAMISSPGVWHEAVHLKERYELETRQVMEILTGSLKVLERFFKQEIAETLYVWPMLGERDPVNVMSKSEPLVIGNFSHGLF